jgi:hypothetical protein
MNARTIAAMLTAAVALLVASPAQASQPINSFEVTTSTTQAGDHPDLGALVSLDAPSQPEAVKNVVVNMPTGVFGNPGAITKCSSVLFALNECPIGSQAGTITVRATYKGNPHYLLGTAPLYNMVPRNENDSALFAFVAPTVNIPVTLPVAVRTASDYGLRMTIAGVTQQIPVEFVQFTVWGFPAEAEHDAERLGVGAPGAPAGCPGALAVTEDCNVPHRAAITVHPLTDNPTVCTGEPLTVELDVQTYEDPDNPSHAEADYPPTSGCEKEIFNPVLNVEVTSAETDSASGMDLQLKAPQFLSHATSPSTIRSANLVLPEGLSVNPDAADGQTSCPDALANFGSEGPANCPDSSKIGIFDIRTVALDGPLTGSIYIGEPQPGNQYRLFMVASGFGINAKLVAEVDPDPQTGRLTISVDDLPQVPFEEFNLHLFASQRGLVATPTHCTIYQVSSVFNPWNDELAPQRSRPTFGLTSGPGGSPCPDVIRPFEPRLAAGTSNPKAKAFSDFTLKLDRDDGDQYLGDLGFTMPPGLTGSLRGIAYCPDAVINAAAQTLGRVEQASPSCPSSSQIGTTNVAAGPGSHPFHAIGRMYLAGPFKGAPLSVAAITPALAGPFDYGTVVVRVAIHVDPLDAHVTALSDTVPSIIGGIPIRMRSIQVNIDKPNFMINPTNCNPLSVGSKGIGAQGTVTDFSSFFQVVDCGDLPFKPRMTIRQLGGRKATGRSEDPSLQFDLRTRSSDANIQSVAVTLPKAFAIDQRHLGNICSKAQLASERCAGRQPIGRVTTTTPLLDQPLSGPAYAVSGFGKLPHVAFILDGQVTIIPQAESSSVNGRLKTIVPVVPDAPIGHFRLTLAGGKKGYLVNTRSLCGSASATTVDYIAQNGKKLSQKVRTKTACGKSEARRKRHR